MRRGWSHVPVSLAGIGEWERTSLVELMRGNGCAESTRNACDLQLQIEIWKRGRFNPPSFSAYNRSCLTELPIQVIRKPAVLLLQTAGKMHKIAWIKAWYGLNWIVTSALQREKAEKVGMQTFYGCSKGQIWCKMNSAEGNRRSPSGRPDCYSKNHFRSPECIVFS